LIASVYVFFHKYEESWDVFVVSLD
jgi:hypothetical protein